MAEKRMFSKGVVDSDMFLDMPLTTQALYFHLGIRADDDGFIDNPRKIQRMIGASVDDLKLLIAKGYVIPFSSGVYVITHWKIHNYIAKDRYHETIHLEEKAQLTVTDSREYRLKDGAANMYTDCIQDVDKTNTQIRLDKSREDKNSLVCAAPSNVPPPDVSPLILNDGSEWLPTLEDFNEWVKFYPGVNVKVEFGRMRQWLLSNPTKRKTKRGIRRFVTNWLDKEQNKATRSAGSGQPNRNPFNRFEQNNYDFDELEKEIVGN